MPRRHLLKRLARNPSGAADMNPQSVGTDAVEERAGPRHAEHVSIGRGSRTYRRSIRETDAEIESVATVLLQRLAVDPSLERDLSGATAAAMERHRRAVEEMNQGDAIGILAQISGRHLDMPGPLRKRHRAQLRWRLGSGQTQQNAGWSQISAGDRLRRADHELRV